MRDSSTFSGDEASPWRVQPSEEQWFTGFEISSSTAATRAIAETRSFGLSKGFHDEGPPMTVLLEEPTAADDQNAQLLFEEARRRRRRLRFIWMAMATTVIVVLVSLGFTLDRSSSPPAHQLGPRRTRSGRRTCAPERRWSMPSTTFGSSTRTPVPLGCFPCQLRTEGAVTWPWSLSGTRSCSTVAIPRGSIREASTGSLSTWAHRMEFSEVRTATRPGCGRSPVRRSSDARTTTHPRWEAFTWSMVRGAR